MYTRRFLNTTLFMLAALFFLLPVTAQDTNVVPEPAKKQEATTAIEKFVARRGRLFIKDIYKIGSIKGQAATSIDVQLLVVSSPSGAVPEKLYGIRFVRPKVLRSDTSALGYLDYDEAKALLEAVIYMQKLAIRMADEDHEETEVIYETRGGMQFSFEQSGRKQTGYARIKGEFAFLTIDNLADLKTLLEQGIERLRDSQQINCSTLAELASHRISDWNSYFRESP